MSDFTKTEIEAVLELNNWLNDPQGDFYGVPEAEILIAAAWYATEDFIRRQTGGCSSTATRKDKHQPEKKAPFTCQCCRYFRHIQARSKELIRRAS